MGHLGLFLLLIVFQRRKGYFALLGPQQGLIWFSIGWVSEDHLELWLLIGYLSCQRDFWWGRGVDENGLKSWSHLLLSLSNLLPSNIWAKPFCWFATPTHFTCLKVETFVFAVPLPSFSILPQNFALPQLILLLSSNLWMAYLSLGRLKSRLFYLLPKYPRSIK